MPEQILKGVDEVDWARLDAEDMPRWLIDLASPEQQIRYDAHSRLMERLVFQGSDNWDYGPLSVLLKNELPLLIVPFLIELLKHQDVKSKDNIIELIEDLATFVRLVDKDSEVYRPLTEQVHDAVREGIRVYRSLLSHPSPRVKMGAAMLLEELGEL